MSRKWKYSLGNRVGNVINLYSHIVTTYCDEHFVMYVNVESLYCTPEANMWTLLELKIKK